jgi:hypothetical protein
MSPFRQKVNTLLSSFHPNDFVELDLEPYREVVVQNEFYYVGVIAPKDR